MSSPPRLLLALALLAVALLCNAQGGNAKADEPVNSSLDRDLFYELLVGELSAQSGDNAGAYALYLDAARRANAPRLYQRAVELALGGRSGESALEAARAWNSAFPAAQDANRYLLQILIGLNRLTDVQEPLRHHLGVLPMPERIAVINMLPRYFSRSTDKKLAATVVEQALAPELANRSSGPAAWAAVGFLRLAAGDSGGSLEAARRGSAMDPGAVEPMYLALGAMNAKVPEAEAMVLHYLAAKVPAEVRMAYLRNLLDSQRVADGYVQAQRLTLEWPDFSDGWLIRGSLEFQAQQWAQAEASLKMGLAHDPEPPAGTETQEMGRGTVQALLLLAQITEQTQRLDEAKAYLARIDSPKDALRVALRQASILARQGKLEEARALIRSAPEVQPEDDRVKINAEVQLLRDHKDYAAAYQRMAEGMARYPQDSDLAYDQAMLAEKLGKTSEMEQLLRSVIAAKPDYYHAYNALGFSFAERNVQLDEARQLILKALEMAPDDPFIVDSLAWVEFRTGNSVEALRLLRGAFKSRPDPEIAAHMGEVLWTMGQRAQALSVWKQGAELSPDNATLLETTARLQGTR